MKLGTPNRPILWFTRKNDGRCMVFYADLSYKEISPEETLKFPPSETGASGRKKKSDGQQ